MNSKSLMTCLLIVILAASTVQGLMINKSQHKIKVAHPAHMYGHMKNHMPVRINKGFRANPSQLNHKMFSAHQQLDQDLRQEGIQLFVQAFDDQNSPQCVQDLDDAKQAKIAGIIIDNYNFNSEELHPLSEDQFQNMKDAIQKDKDFENDDLQCFIDNRDALNQLLTVG